MEKPTSERMPAPLATSVITITHQSSNALGDEVRGWGRCA